MKLRLTQWLLVALLVCSFTYAVSVAAEESGDKKPKHEIKDIMRKAHTPKKEGEKSLRDIVLGGQASDEQKQELLDLYISLTENKPPKGDEKAFQEKVQPIIVAAAKVVVGRDGAVEELRGAVNCAACHKEHKPPQK